ncbi:hypothetical protein CK203_038567 [Vitis vinifera]|uniref:Uncharacterized protein n=1 Tax=Vitis vinifera TaxID=29760 RepID=A0A438I3Y4_VITVI|nr:hypothetical protein CK203_038567 [Vitis vinifera]
MVQTKIRGVVHSGVMLRRELTKKGRDATEVINGENLRGSSGAVKGERDRSGEGGAMQEGVEPKHGETGSLPGEKRSEAWVRIVGLPVSLWERDILRRIGMPVGFLDIDSQTETLEDLQWARILVKLNKEKPPNVVEVWTEEFCYELTLWWEIRPAVRMARERKGKANLFQKRGRGGQSSGRSGYGSGFRFGVRWAPRIVWGGAAVGPWPSDASGPSPHGLSLRGFEVRLVSGLLRGRRHLRGPVPKWAGPSSVGALTSPGRSMVTDGLWRPSLRSKAGGDSKTDDALMEEALRRIPEGFYDRRMIGRMPVVMKTVDCREILDDNNGVMGSNGKELCLVGDRFQNQDWREASWEESELARFNQFLGFSTVGLEKDILDFMVKIRKRWEKVHNKSLLENSKFERELKRLEWSINYEGGRKQKGIVQGRGASIQLFYEAKETKIQSMTEGCEDLGSGRFLIGGLWEPKAQRVEGEEELWEELGAIKGIWEEPWCLGGDFNVTLSQRDRSRQGNLNGAMRRFAQVVDDLALIDLPLQGGVYSWSGGRGNQTWARLDRFLVSQVGGGMSWGPSPFRFENMWLKVDGLRSSFGNGGKEGKE